MKHLFFATTIAASSLTTGAAAVNLDLINGFTISENVSMENCLSIAEKAIKKTGMQVSTNPEGAFSEVVQMMVPCLRRFGVCRSPPVSRRLYQP